MHQDSKVPFSSVDNVSIATKIINVTFKIVLSQLKLEFIDNNAVEATAILMDTVQQCSWIEYSPPYFDPAAVLRWNFLNIR